MLGQVVQDGGSVLFRGGTRLPSECNYLQKNSSLWRLSIDNRNKHEYSAVDFAADCHPYYKYDSIATVGEIRVYWRADFQSGSRVLKKVF